MVRRQEKILHTAVIVLLANSYVLNRMWHIPAIFLVLLILAFVWMQFVPAYHTKEIHSMRLRVCYSGCRLLFLFIISTFITILFSIFGYAGILPGMGSFLQEIRFWLLHSVIAFLVEAIVFWNGMIRVYVTSIQLGIRIRVLGVLFGMVPIAHLIMLGIILHTVWKEVCFEEVKLRQNIARKDEQICATKYPILLVHGVFFRDFRYLNYWGRIPAELTTNGACIYYGNQPSALSVAENAEYIAKRIRGVLAETGAEKINIIAHSKGGLDCRYAISKLGMANQVASLTTINTPHRGCEFADYLLEKIPKRQQRMLENVYNRTLLKMGDPKADFMSAVKDLTVASCRKRNEQLPDMPGVYYQSVGSKLNVPANGRFPLNFTTRLVARFDGVNDGLVGESSFPWGENYKFLTVKGKRGISHGDMIDLNRENFDGFDVREFYVQLVCQLKKKGF